MSMGPYRGRCFTCGHDHDKDRILDVIRSCASEREEIDQAFSQAYFLVTGKSPAFSETFGIKEALVEIEDACKILRLKVAPAQGADARPAAITLPSVEEMQAALSLAHESIAQLERERTVTREQLNTPMGGDFAPLTEERKSAIASSVEQRYGESIRAAVDLATRDAAPSDAQDAERYQWVTYVAENANILHTVVLCHEGDQDKINERIDSYRATSAPRENT